jgi:23S rRNA (uridine2552-2'-O)-methyltransferase
MKKHQSKQQWLDEHVNDEYVKKAQKDGYRSRAAYKLLEINERDHILSSGMKVVDLGAAPGGWLQVAVKIVGKKGQVIGLDLLEIEPVHDVVFLQGDFREDDIYEALMSELKGEKVDVVISDMAPNISGMDTVDQPRSIYLGELVQEFSHQVLKKGGCVLLKLFQGAGFDEYVSSLRRDFSKVYIRKPRASRARSREVYVLAKGYLN